MEIGMGLEGKRKSLPDEITLKDTEQNFSSNGENPGIFSYNSDQTKRQTQL